MYFSFIMTPLISWLQWFTEVPDYLEFVSQPMDFSTIRTKLEGHGYYSITDLERDFELMISNCLKYNSKDTMFHKMALQLREVGGAVLRHAHRQSQSIGLDPNTGMHLPEAPNKHGFYNCTWDDGELRMATRFFLMNLTNMPSVFYVYFPSVDPLLDPDNRLHLTTDEQLKALLDKLDMVSSMRTSGGRTKRIRLLRREINTIRQKMNQQPNTQCVNGNDKDDEGPDNEGEEEEEEEEKEKKSEKMDVVDNGHLTAVSNSGTGKITFTMYYSVALL